MLWLEEIGDDAFHIAKHNMFSSLGSIEFPSTLQSVCNCAFSGCNRLKKLLLNEGLQTIGGAAFSQCYRLRSVEFPSTFCEVGPYAFQDCTQLNKVVLNGKCAVEVASCPSGGISFLKPTYGKKRYQRVSLEIIRAAAFERLTWKQRISISMQLTFQR